MSDAHVSDPGTEQGTTGSGGPTFGRWMGSMWLYTLLRIALFGALWLIMLLVGLRGYFALMAALAVSVPLSFFLLAKPRAAFAAQIEHRLEARRQERAELDKRLDPNPDDSDTR